MPVIKTEQTVEFYDTGGKICGIYHYMDPFKSFFRGLYTPSGNDVVAYPPPDHPHHKGLQFGLCTSKANFWEEPGAAVPNDKLPFGQQRTTSLVLLSPVEGIGFTQEVLWEVDEVEKEPVFNETRTISMEEKPGAYVWTWKTTVTAAWEDVQITRSVWNVPSYCQPWLGYGYCGLGLRLARDLFQDAEVFPADPQCGSTPAWVSFKGKAQVRFDQVATPPDALFVSTYEGKAPYDGPDAPGFAFMGFVPIPRDLKQGQSLDARYTITVSDV